MAVGYLAEVGPFLFGPIHADKGIVLDRIFFSIIKIILVVPAVLAVGYCGRRN